MEQLEYVFCSHAHEDHVGGLAAALAYFPADHVYSPVTQASTKCFQDFVKYTQQQGLQLEVPSVGTDLAPGKREHHPAGPGNAVQRDQRYLHCAAHRLRQHQLSADRSTWKKTAETDLVNSGANLRADVLQVGHHGSQHLHQLPLFLNAVLPEMGIISCGVNNKNTATPTRKR